MMMKKEVILNKQDVLTNKYLIIQFIYNQLKNNLMVQIIENEGDHIKQKAIKDQYNLDVQSLSY